MACGGGDREAGRGAGRGATLVVPDDARLRSVPVERLVSLSARAAEQAQVHEGSERGVALARDLARVTRALAARGAADGTWPRTRRWLRRAARQTTVPGACAAGLELARLESTLGADLPAAYAVAHGLVDRYGSVSGARGCVAEARRMLRILEPHKPSAEVLAELSLESEVASSEAAELDPERAAARDDLALAGLVAEHAEEESQATTLERIDVYGAAARGAAGATPAAVRAVLYFDGVAVYRRGEVEPSAGVGRRVFLDLDGISPRSGLKPHLSVSAGGLERVRTVSVGDSSTRVSFDVEDETAHRLFVLTSPYRIVMDFARGGPRRARARWTVVLDPGHGGSQPGAKSADGLRESDVALALARRAKRALERRLPDAAVFLTRDGDYSVSLEERTAIANGYEADVFVSIHLNASESPEDRGGVATFVLDTKGDEAALRLAARENGTDAADVTALQALLASLYRADQVEHSLSLAELVHGDTLSLGRRTLPDLPDRGVKRALFYVLVGARMPAILLEASFITRPEEAKALRTDTYRDQLGEGIAAGIDRYLRKQALEKR